MNLDLPVNNSGRSRMVSPSQTTREHQYFGCNILVATSLPIDTREGGIGNGSARDHVRLYLAMQVGKPFEAETFIQEKL